MEQTSTYTPGPADAVPAEDQAPFSTDGMSPGEIEASCALTVIDGLQRAREALQHLRTSRLGRGDPAASAPLFVMSRTLDTMAALLPAVLATPKELAPGRRAYVHQIVKMERLLSERDTLLATLDHLYGQAIAATVAAEEASRSDALGGCTLCQLALYGGDRGYYAEGVMLCEEHAPTYEDMAAALKEELDDDDAYKPDWAEDREAAYSQAKVWAAKGACSMLTIL